VLDNLSTGHRWAVPEVAIRTASDHRTLQGMANAKLWHSIDKVASGSYQLFMRSVGLKVLKNKLSEYVRIAAGGETVLITDRDHVVAEIVPPHPGRSPFLMDALLAEAVREGWLAPPLLAGSDPPPRKPVMTLRNLMQDLQQDREDR
jgi:antitoxin (DNA-binding transcriptional repressor) of toxin-antitoxin stability system